MELALILLFSSLGVAAFIFFLILLSQAHYLKYHKKTQHKFSDAEVFRVMSEANHFITPKQLAAISPLTEKEARTRLSYLAIFGVLQQFVCSADWSTAVYQLNEEIPPTNQPIATLQGLSDRAVVEHIHQHVDDYQVTIAELVILFGIDIYEAKDLVKRLVKSGFVEKYTKNFKAIYVIKNPLQMTPPLLENRVATVQNDKIKLTNTTRIKIPDAEVLRLAIENEGKITATQLCLALKIPVQEATQKLEALYDQGAFQMDTDSTNTVLEYHLVDNNLL